MRDSIVLIALVGLNVASWIVMYKLVTQLTNKIIAPTPETYAQITRSAKPPKPVVAANPPRQTEFVDLELVPDEDLFAAMEQLPE